MILPRPYSKNLVYVGQHRGGQVLGLGQLQSGHTDVDDALLVHHAEPLVLLEVVHVVRALKQREEPAVAPAHEAPPDGANRPDGRGPLQAPLTH